MLLKIELSEITPFFYNIFFGWGGDFPPFPLATPLPLAPKLSLVNLNSYIELFDFAQILVYEWLWNNFIGWNILNSKDYRAVYPPVSVSTANHYTNTIILRKDDRVWACKDRLLQSWFLCDFSFDLLVKSIPWNRYREISKHYVIF